jgi:hypothetical protein
MTMDALEDKPKPQLKMTECEQARSFPELRKEITTLVKSSAVDMVTETIKQVNEGHYAAMKYLFEMIGLFPAPPQEETPPEDSLARMLLLRLGLPDEPMPAGKVTQDREPDSAAHAGDTVE